MLHTDSLDKSIFLLLLWVCSLLPLSSYAQNTLNIAVASNFAPTLKDILAQYRTKQEKPTKIRLIIGSSGKHFAQIINGAPYDLFFSADQHKPQELIKRGIVSESDVFTYATGRLILWSNQSSPQISVLKQLQQSPIMQAHKKPTKQTPALTIANPKLAPYGLAAKQTLQKLKLWNTYKTSLVLGENINQTFHFVNSSSVPFGFIAYSQWLTLKKITQSPKHSWLVPNDYHSPIIQQVAMLQHTTTSKNFIQFIQTNSIRQLIEQHGYSAHNSSR